MILAALTLATLQSRIQSTHGLHERRADYYKIDFTWPVFRGGRLADFANAQIAQIRKQDVTEWKKQNAPAWTSKPRVEYFFLAGSTVSLDRADLISFFFTISTYEAGAHPMTVFAPYTFAMVGGKPTLIHAKNLFNAGFDYRHEVSTVVIGKLLDIDRAMWVQNGQVKSLTPKQVDSFVITPTRITWLFDPYDMGPYVSGSFKVPVPFSVFRGELDPNGPLSSLLTG